MTSRNLDGGLWWDLDDEAREAAKQSAAGTVHEPEPEDLFFALQEVLLQASVVEPFLSPRKTSSTLDCNNLHTS